MTSRKTDWKETLIAWEQSIGGHVCIHDFHGRLTGLDGEGIIPLFHKNHFCEKFRSSPERYRKCLQCDTRHAKFHQNAPGGVFWKRCHAGAVEAVFPISLHQQLVGVLFWGVFAAEEDQLFPFDECPGTKNVPLPLLSPALRNVIECSGKLLCSELAHLLEEQEENSRDVNRHARIECFFEHRFRSPDISLPLLAEHLGLGISRTANILRMEFHTNFPDMLNTYRLECAKQILSHSDEPICCIAELAGFRTVNYFHRRFLREFGLTPGEWRKQNGLKKRR